MTSEQQEIEEGTARTVAYTYDKAGNRVSMLYHGGVTTTAYGYDQRDRGTRIDREGSHLAWYEWIGSAFRRHYIYTDDAVPGAGDCG